MSVKTCEIIQQAHNHVSNTDLIRFISKQATGRNGSAAVGGSSSPSTAPCLNDTMRRDDTEEHSGMYLKDCELRPLQLIDARSDGTTNVQYSKVIVKLQRSNNSVHQQRIPLELKKVENIEEEQQQWTQNTMINPNEYIQKDECKKILLNTVQDPIEWRTMMNDGLPQDENGRLADSTFLQTLHNRNDMKGEQETELHNYRNEHYIHVGATKVVVEEGKEKYQDDEQQSNERSHIRMNSMNHRMSDILGNIDDHDDIKDNGYVIDVGVGNHHPALVEIPPYKLHAREENLVLHSPKQVQGK